MPDIFKNMIAATVALVMWIILSVAVSHPIQITVTRALFIILSTTTVLLVYDWIATRLRDFLSGRRIKTNTQNSSLPNIGSQLLRFEEARRILGDRNLCSPEDLKEIDNDLVAVCREEKGSRSVFPDITMQLMKKWTQNGVVSGVDVPVIEHFYVDGGGVAITRTIRGYLLLLTISNNGNTMLTIMRNMRTPLEETASVDAHLMKLL